MPKRKFKVLFPVFRKIDDVNQWLGDRQTGFEVNVGTSIKYLTDSDGWSYYEARVLGFGLALSIDKNYEI